MAGWDTSQTTVFFQTYENSVQGLNIEFKLLWDINHRKLSMMSFYGSSLCGANSSLWSKIKNIFNPFQSYVFQNPVLIALKK